MMFRPLMLLMDMTLDWITIGTLTVARPSLSIVTCALLLTGSFGGKMLLVRCGFSGSPDEALSIQMLAATV